MRLHMKNFLIPATLFTAMLNVNPAFGQDSLNVRALFNWQDPSLPASSTWSNTYNEIWGHEVNGREFAIIGSTNGTHIFDVTDPVNSYEAAFIEGAATGTQVIHRHFDTFGDYLYMVCDEGPSTLQIADLSFLPDSAPLVYDSNELFSRAHNCFVDKTTAHLYVVGNSNWAAIYSLEDPTVPTLVVNCRYDIPWWDSIGYLHDIYVRNDTAYCNAETRGLFVVDFTDKQNPVMLGSMPVYPQQGYNHSGWLMDDAPYYAMADETHGMAVKLVDVSDLQNLQVASLMTSDIDQYSIPHNVAFRDNLLYVSYYFDGMYVFDCSDPANPTLAGFYDTSTETHANNDYRGCWGVYTQLPSGRILASDMQTGLWVFDTSELLSTSTSEDLTGNQNRLTVFPNPSSDAVHVNLEFAGMPYNIADLSGKILYRGTIEENGLVASLAAMGQGVYVLTVNSDNGTLRTTVVRK